LRLGAEIGPLRADGIHPGAPDRNQQRHRAKEKKTRLHWCAVSLARGFWPVKS